MSIEYYLMHTNIDKSIDKTILIMEKIKVVTFNGALKLLEISNRTFYTNYRPFVKPCGFKGKAALYTVDELTKRQNEINAEKKFSEKFEIIA